MVFVLTLNQRIHIIHTNDLHSRFENMPKISSYIQQVRKEAAEQGERVIVVDIGDHMDRMKLETEGTFGRVNVEILNQTGVEVVTIGNNEGLTFTKGNLEKAYQERNFNIVVCNLIDIVTKQKPNWVKDYWIQEVDGIKIGWIGATAPYETFYRLQGWEVLEPMPFIQNIVEQIRHEVDLIIFLSHLGIRADEQIAEEIPVIDVIIGGHTHRFYEHGLQKEGQPLICQVGIFGDYIGHLTIDFNRKERKIINIEEKTVQMESFQDDPIIVEVVKTFREQAKSELNQIVTILEEPLPIFLEMESPLGNLLADGVRSWVNAEIGLVNAGQILQGLEKGKVTKERIHEICPSPINPCIVKLTGSQIMQTLEQSLLDEFIHFPLKGFGFRGKEIGTLCLSGIKAEIDPLAEPYKRVKKVWVGNEEMVEDQEYIVGTLDMFTFGGGYPLIKEGKEIQYFLPEFIRDILATQLKEQAAIVKSFTKRWVSINIKDRV